MVFVKKCIFCVEKPCLLQQPKKLYLSYLTIVLVGIFMTHLPQTIHQTVTTRKSFLSPLLFEETFALFSILLYFFSVASEGNWRKFSIQFLIRYFAFQTCMLHYFAYRKRWSMIIGLLFSFWVGEKYAQADFIWVKSQALLGYLVVIKSKPSWRIFGSARPRTSKISWIEPKFWSSFVNLFLSIGLMLFSSNQNTGTRFTQE